MQKGNRNTLKTSLCRQHYFVLSFFFSSRLLSLKLIVAALFTLKHMIDFVSFWPCCRLFSPPLLSHLAFVLHCSSPHPWSGPGPFRLVDIVVIILSHTALPGCLVVQYNNSSQTNLCYNHFFSSTKYQHVKCKSKFPIVSLEVIHPIKFNSPLND